MIILRPLYEKGLDAVIVQDTGVFQFIRSNFPDLDIHASTQMTITGAAGAKFLESQGRQELSRQESFRWKKFDRFMKQRTLK